MTQIQVEIDNALQEKIDSGVLNLKVGGVFSYQHIRDGEIIAEGASPNIVVDEGLNYILDTALSAGTQLVGFNVGIFKNNYTPQATDVMATFAGAGVSGEIDSEVDETTRPVWTDAGVAAKALTNAASPAVFTANTTVNAYGAFLSSDSVLSGTSGSLIAAAKFTSVRALVDTDVLNVTYTLTIADA